MKLKWIPTAAASAALLFLAGCGGGGGATPADTTTAVGVTVIDGAIENAMVCLDKNLNSACDADEPSARTDASGNATLQVDEADAGKYPVVAIVGTDAIDADHGPVTTPFTLKAPADKPAVVSPLTTLVQTNIEATGTTTAEAEAAVQAQIGMNVSLFTDFTKDTSTEGATLGALARLVVVTTQEQTKALETSVGTEAIDGSTITAADLDEVIRRKMLEIMQTFVTTLTDPAVQTAIATGDPVQINAALTPKIADVVATTNLTADSIGTVVGIANQSSAPEPTATPEAAATLAGLNFADAANWFRRVFTGSVAQNTPDASGNTRFVDRRSASSSGAIANWSFGGSAGGQASLHWNGSKWTNCPIGFQSTSGPRDAQGRGSYDYCDKTDMGFSTRAAFDIAGKRMIDVYNQATGAGYVNLVIQDAAAALGTVTFPTGSKLYYQNTIPSAPAITFSPGLGNVVRVHSIPALINGEKATCDTITSTKPVSEYTKEAATLEDLVSAVRGNVCAYGVHTETGKGGVTISSGSRNEAWGIPSVSIGTLGHVALTGSPSNSTTFWSGNTLLRVAFGDNNATKYYACQQRSWDGSTRNCDLIGTGTYAITTMDDARVLTLQNTPQQAAAVPERVFVQRGGKVYFGQKSRPFASNSARMNLAAANALFDRLGMPSVDPSSSFMATAATYQGEWVMWNPATTGLTAIRIAPHFTGTNTAYQCVDYADITTSAGGAEPYACTLTSFHAATGAFSVDVTGEGTLAGTLNLDTSRVTATFTPVSGSVENLIGGRR